MSGSVRLDVKFPTVEQEAPLVPHPARAVEVFSQGDRIYLRVGPVEGVNPAHGSYTLMLTRAEAGQIAEALHELASGLQAGPPRSTAAEAALLRPHHNTW